MAPGITTADRAEKGPDPTALMAWTRSATEVPLARPVTVRLVAPAAAGRRAPIGVPVPALTTCTASPVIGDPPLAGAVHVTVAVPVPAVAVPIAGAAGSVTGVTTLDRVENGPDPTALTAWTRSATGVPLARPLTMMVVAPAPAGCRPPIGLPVPALTTCAT